MDAKTILQQISDKTELEWGDTSMLYIACQYIDNQKDSDCFRSFVERFAAEELNDFDFQPDFDEAEAEDAAKE